VGCGEKCGQIVQEDRFTVEAKKVKGWAINQRDRERGIMAMPKGKRVVMAGMLVVGVFLSLLVLMAPRTASAAYDTFICIDDIRGDSASKVEACGAAIEVVSWSFGVVSEDSPGKMGSSGGKINITPDFKFVTRTSKASPALFQYATTKKTSKRAILTARKPGGSGSQQEFLRITLNDVVVSSFLSLGNSKSAEAYPMEEIILKFNRIEIECWEFGSDGSRKSSVKANWDVQTGSGK
jgi:type VI secretion system secreted protein Hcp